MDYKVYEDSIQELACMVDLGDRDVVVSYSKAGFKGVPFGDGRVMSELNHETADQIRKLYPWAAPSRVLERDKTMGVGDRLGIATDGHIRVFNKCDVTPIFAQQSIRELNLTGRTFNDVIDAATFAVFRCGFMSGWGADGDHVKTASEVDYALTSGATMITLDCSEQIDNTIEGLDKASVDAKYASFDSGSVDKATFESLYLNKSFDIGEGLVISFDEELFKRTVLIYSKALDHAEGIFKNNVVRDGVQLADFEVSIDETLTPTLPVQHFFVSSELVRRGVHIATVAPRFCGEFQKGIDYIGNLDQFAAEMKVHAEIARHFGYKLSIHSGSDKFSAFPSAGKETRGRFHLKTAGTNWLEAMKLVAMKDPALYREIHQYALDYAFAKATAYYHVTTNLNNIPALSTLSDAQLPDLFKNNDSRQLIHITYGLILSEKNADGTSRFRDRLYKVWREYREEYYQLLDSHIGHHVSAILGK